jgi:hypothetical protein
LPIGDAPAGLTVGYGGGVRLHAALLPLGPLRFGVGVQFAYDRLSRDKPGASVTSTTQALSHATFAALAILDGLFGRLRPWVGIGGGFSVAGYDDPSVNGSPPMPVHLATVVPLVQVAAGLGVQVYESFEIGLRTDVNLTFSSAAAGQPPRTVFEPGLATLSLDLGFRF